MSKCTIRKKNHVVQSKTYQMNTQSFYTAEELSQIISMAILHAEKTKKDMESKEREFQFNAWLKSIKSPQLEKGLRGWRRALAYVRSMWYVVKISYKQREIVEGTQHLENFLISLLQIAFIIGDAILAFVSIVLIFYAPYEWFCGGLRLFWLYYVFLEILGLLIFVLSRVFKIISDELRIVNDTNTIFALFSCIVSFISLVVAVLALLKG